MILTLAYLWFMIGCEVAISYSGSVLFGFRVIRKFQETERNSFCVELQGFKDEVDTYLVGDRYPFEIQI